MASLKEIKSRIQSVKSTQKITSAMKMVSSAKLRKAQKQIESFYPYEQKLTQILTGFLAAEDGDGNTSIFAEQRAVERWQLLRFLLIQVCVAVLILMLPKNCLPLLMLINI